MDKSKSRSFVSNCDIDPHYESDSKRSGIPDDNRSRLEGETTKETIFKVVQSDASSLNKLEGSRKHFKRSKISNIGLNTNNSSLLSTSDLSSAGNSHRNDSGAQNVKRLKRCTRNTASVSTADLPTTSSLSSSFRQGSVGDSMPSIDTGGGQETDAGVSPVFPSRVSLTKEQGATSASDCLTLVLAMKKRELFQDPSVLSMLRQITETIKN